MIVWIKTNAGKAIPGRIKGVDPLPRTGELG